MKYILILTFLNVIIFGCYETKSVSFSAKNETHFEYAPVVRTEAGQVRGVVEVVKESDEKVYLYQGIKYGK